MHHNPFIFQEFEIDPGLITEQKAEVENKVRVLDSSFRQCLAVCYFNFYIFWCSQIGLVRKEMSWEAEKHRIGLRKLQKR